MWGITPPPAMVACTHTRMDGRQENRWTQFEQNADAPARNLERPLKETTALPLLLFLVRLSFRVAVEQISSW
jgi:hypothetical protein